MAGENGATQRKTSTMRLHTLLEGLREDCEILLRSPRQATDGVLEKELKRYLSTPRLCDTIYCSDEEAVPLYAEKETDENAVMQAVKTYLEGDSRVASMSSLLSETEDIHTRIDDDIQDMKSEKENEDTNVNADVVHVYKRRIEELEAQQEEQFTKIEMLEDEKHAAGQKIRVLEAAQYELHHLYTEEQQLRKTLHEKLVEIGGTIRVFCRIRGGEGETAGVTKLFRLENDRISLRNSTGTLESVVCNNVFGPDSRTEDVYDSLADTVESVLDGYNTSIISYGQTGSGKTYSMIGDTKATYRQSICKLACATLLQMSASPRFGANVSVECSIVEIYNEKLNDLLLSPPACDGDPPSALGGGTKRRGPSIRHGTDNAEMIGQTRVLIESEDHLGKLLESASKRRKTAPTKMNPQSSRSHLVITLYVTASATDGSKAICSKLNLVDLAGSERIGKSGAQGEQRTEAIGINKSLFALGDMVAALHGKSAHVPFRNSKLCEVLKASVMSKAKMTLLVNLSHRVQDIEESRFSLQFAKKALSTEIGAAKRTPGAHPRDRQC